MFGQGIFTQPLDNESSMPVYVDELWWQTVYSTANDIHQNLQGMSSTMKYASTTSNYLLHRSAMINTQITTSDTQIQRVMKWAKNGQEMQRTFFDKTEYWFVVKTLQETAQAFNKDNAQYPTFHDYLGSTSSDTLFVGHPVRWAHMMNHAENLLQVIREAHDVIILPVNGQILAQRSMNVHSYSA